MNRLLGALFVCVALATAFVFCGAPEADARPGGGPTFGAASGTSRTAPGLPSRGGRRPSGRDAAARSASYEVEPWSSRPAYASPWSAPAPQTYEKGRRGPATTTLPSGSVVSYYFWIVVAAAAGTLLGWVLSLTRRKQQAPWTSRSGVTPPEGGA